jgi:hypothetical protein
VLEPRRPLHCLHFRRNSEFELKGRNSLHNAESQKTSQLSCWNHGAPFTAFIFDVASLGYKWTAAKTETFIFGGKPSFFRLYNQRGLGGFLPRKHKMEVAQNPKRGRQDEELPGADLGRGGPWKLKRTIASVSKKEVQLADVQADLARLQQRCNRMLLDKDTTDVEFFFEDSCDIINAHRAMLCAVSSGFRCMFRRLVQFFPTKQTLF